jgi:predicted GNAT family acetyltransferase
MPAALAIHPLTPDRFDDLVDLFGPHVGGNSGCWCMWWRMARADWKAASREERRDRFRSIVKAGPPPGILAYDGESAVGWCAIGSRATLPRMNNSRVAAPLESVEGVFAVNCFFIRSGWRKRGLMRILLDGAVKFAAGQGATIVEACPLDVDRELFWGEGFVGIASVFRDADFTEAARRSKNRPLMRKVIRGRRGRRASSPGAKLRAAK